MDVKLTLKLNSDSIQKAKNYVAAEGISLSRLVESFFESISSPSAPRTTEYSSLVRELDGIISLPDDYDFKADYEEYLSTKYE